MCGSGLKGDDVMKKTIFVAFLLLLGSFVLGAVVGTIIDQNQFDAIDFQTLSLEFKIVRIEITDTAIILTVDYITLTRQEGGGWVFISSSTKFEYYLEAYHNCRVAGNTKAECIEEAENHLIDQAKSFRSNVRTDLETEKTKGFIDELTAKDISLTNEQLNEG